MASCVMFAISSIQRKLIVVVYYEMRREVGMGTIINILGLKICTITNSGYRHLDNLGATDVTPS